MDLKHQVMILKLLKQIAKERKLTIILSLHDLSEAAFLGDKLFWMKNGEIIHEGDSSSISEERIKEIYDIDVKIIKDGDKPIIELY